MKKILGALAAIVIFTGCYYDKANELYPSTTTAATCDTANITFAKDILPIAQQKCAASIGCHNAADKSNGYDLTGYTGMKLAVDDGKLVGCITWAPGYIAMPQNTAKLDDCTINKILRWVNQGAQNN